eukprot:gnl/TRDRNA2_/TRDRNA2_183736_c0_seq1.p1 gnl/TRDRNA2_/TRDRNA2_183736_c0~~gnl/TRDRNA2_/TRDRNA2_183736_c0_seq1.p1  ORF type:complete len:423 (-),score=54.83 gnl/TRDRNA2_/TRDRNA2_183736_c0_seq1:213-1481(-)
MVGQSDSPSASKKFCEDAETASTQSSLDEESSRTSESRSECEPLVQGKMPTVPPVELLVVKILKGLFISAIYIVISSGLIFYNKYVLSAERIPYAGFLTMFHALTTTIFSSILYKLMPSLFPTMHVVVQDYAGPQPRWLVGEAAAARSCLFSIKQILAIVLPFIPIGLCGAVALVFSNGAYHYAEVSFLQMVKESGIVITYVLSVAKGLETLSAANVSVLMFITASAVLAVYSAGMQPEKFSQAGLVLQLIANSGQSLQMVLMNSLMSTRKGPRLDPLTAVLCTAPCVFFTLLFVAIAQCDAVLIMRVRTYLPLLLGNCCLAFALQVTNAFAIRWLSATGLCLAAVSRDIVIMTVASVVLGEHLAHLQVVGFTGCIIGIVAYSSLKTFPELFGVTRTPSGRTSSETNAAESLLTKKRCVREV